MPIHRLATEYANRLSGGDKREPLLVSPCIDAGTYGILAPEAAFWAATVALLAIQSILNTIAGLTIYFIIVKKEGTPLSYRYLCGYGILVPCLLTIPFYLIDLFDIRNGALKVGFGGSAAVVVFRCIMAMHATTPSFAKNDVRTYILFCVAPIQFNFDWKKGSARPASSADKMKKIGKLCESVFAIMILFSLLIPRSYNLFPRKEIQSVLDLLYWGNICNNYVMAYLTLRCLEVGTLAVGVMTELVTGFSVMELSNAPLIASRSPSDFWGRRWNSLVHGLLKGAVYIPMRNGGFSKDLAALATFVASGLLHEYVLAVIEYNSVIDVPPKYGYHLAFFAWNGLVLIIENVLKTNSLVKWSSANLPSPIITALVVMTVLPIGHWFTVEYVELGFYSDCAIGVPQVVRL